MKDGFFAGEFHRERPFSSRRERIIYLYSCEIAASLSLLAMTPKKQSPRVAIHSLNSPQPNVMPVPLALMRGAIATRQSLVLFVIARFMDWWQRHEQHSACALRRRSLCLTGKTGNKDGLFSYAFTRNFKPNILITLYFWIPLTV